MNTKKTIRVLILVALLVFMSIFTVACNRNKDNGNNNQDDTPPSKTEWPEAGEYYYDSGKEEYTLTLNVGDTFVLVMKGQNSSGTYTLNSDGTMVLDFLE